MMDSSFLHFYMLHKFFILIHGHFITPFVFGMAIMPFDPFDRNIMFVVQI